MIDEHKKYYRMFTDLEYDEMTDDKINSEFTRINELENYKHLNKEEKIVVLKKLQRTRYLMIWHDTSCISNHSHLLIMVKTIYDPAIFFNNKEYAEIYKNKINIQVEVEKPLIYLIARCPPTDDQIKYSSTRMEDIKDLQIKVSTDICEINDVLRFFHGDGPACSFEIGHQKGGNYFCWDCCIHSNYANDIPHTYYTNSIDITSRLNKISLSTNSRGKLANAKLHLYNNLSKIDIIEELHQRETKFKQSMNKDVLQQLLTKEMMGIQNAPALLVPNIKNQLDLINYEILANEPMHDIAGHWKNLVEELPYHLNKNEKKLFKDIVSLTLNKETKRAVDYRETALNLCINLKGKVNIDIYSIIQTGCEIQEMIYALQEERNVAMILRCHLKCYIHSHLLISLIGNKPKSLTKRKIFGKYFHAISRHAGKQLRIVCGKSAHAEQEERNFNLMKSITKLTSNHHPNNVIMNLWIRLQAREILYEKVNTYQRENTKIQKLNDLLPAKKNTTISFHHIQSYPDEWQAFLETMIPDYLTERGVWWKEEENECEIEFFDSSANTLSILNVHHFRSSSIIEEEAYLNKMWGICLEDKDRLIPAKRLKEEINNEIKITSLTTIKHFQPPVKTSIMEDIPTSQQEKNSSTSTNIKESGSNYQDSNHEIDFTIQALSTNLEKLDPVSISISTEQADSLILISNCNENVGLSNQETSTNINKNLSIHTETEEFDEIIEYDEENIETICNFIPPSIITENKFETKTAGLLEQAIGSNELIRRFDKIRAKLKRNINSIIYWNEYKDIVAQLEVIILPKYYDLKSKLKNIEQTTFHNSSTLNVIPKDRSEYDAIKYKLKILQIIKTELLS